MLRLILKHLIPFGLRRFIRNGQSNLRLKLRNCFYQVWILKYDRHSKHQQDLHPDFIAVLNDHSTLTADALHHINAFLTENPNIDLIYTDSDQINPLGLRFNPYFKPDWDPYLFLEQDFLQPFYVVRRSILSTDGSLPADLNNYNIKHLPKVLCHSHRPFQIKRPSASAHLQLPKSLPLLSIIIPTKDGLSLLKPCIDSLLAKNKNLDFEILIVNNNSEKPETLDYFKKRQSAVIRVLDYPHPFNYSAINNFAVEQARGEMLLLLNNDIEALSENSLKHMLGLALQKDVGIVGAKLYYPNNTIQHAGIVLGIDGTSRHILTGLKAHDPGYFGNLQNMHCCSAVTAACLMIKKTLYEKVHGLDETAFPITFNDIDLCLKIRDQGLKVIFTPDAEFYHKESATRGEDLSSEKRLRVQQETDRFINKWQHALQQDPFYNPNLSLKSTDYALAFPPRYAILD